MNGIDNVQQSRCGIYGPNTPEWFTTMEVMPIHNWVMLSARLCEVVNASERMLFHNHPADLYLGISWASRLADHRAFSAFRSMIHLVSCLCLKICILI